MERQDVEKAIGLQIRLRGVGRPKGVANLLIAAICINRGEKLITKDENFKDIAEVSELELEIIS
ncbi:MAG: hypothetical protein ACTSXJ_09215 [Candidatus Baldrarchaeia archaeon]